MTIASPEKSARVTESGKLNLPAQHRKMVGLEHGGPVRIRVVDGEIRIRTVEATMQSLQSEARTLLANDSVDAFLADKRQDAARENGET